MNELDIAVSEYNHNLHKFVEYITNLELKPRYTEEDLKRTIDGYHKIQSVAKTTLDKPLGKIYEEYYKIH